MKIIIEMRGNYCEVEFEDKEGKKQFIDLDFADRLRVLHTLPIVTQSLKNEHSNTL